MFIDRLCPGLVPAIRQAFEIEMPGRSDIVVDTLIQFGALLLALVYWIGSDVVAFILRECRVMCWFPWWSKSTLTNRRRVRLRRERERQWSIAVLKRRLERLEGRRAD